jgi:hypothetical protein
MEQQHLAGVCSADAAVAAFWFGGPVGSWRAETRRQVWCAFLQTVEGVAMFPFLEADYLQRLMVAIFHAIGPCTTADAHRVRAVRGVVDFLDRRAKGELDQSAGPATGQGTGQATAQGTRQATGQNGGQSADDGAGQGLGPAFDAPHVFSPSEAAWADRLLRLLRHGYGNHAPFNLNAEMMGPASEAGAKALQAPGLDPQAICHAVPDIAKAFAEACRMIQKGNAVMYDDNLMFEQAPQHLGVMRVTADASAEGRVHNTRKWVVATLRRLQHTGVQVHAALRAGETYTFLRETVPASPTTHDSATTSPGRACKPASGPVHLRAFLKQEAVGQVVMPPNFSGAPTCRGTSEFLQDVHTHTVLGLLLGSAFRLHRCPSSLVTPPERTYIVTQLLRDGSGGIRHVALVYADRWTEVPPAAVASVDTYRFQQLVLRLQETWSARACMHGLCP